MSLKFNEVKMFLRLRDRTIEIVPHYSDDAKLDSVGIRRGAGGDLEMVGMGRTAEATVDSIVAKSAELRAQSA